MQSGRECIEVKKIWYVADGFYLLIRLRLWKKRKDSVDRILDSKAMTYDRPYQSHANVRKANKQ